MSRGAPGSIEPMGNDLEQIQPKSVLVTGATGFVGSRLLSRLLSEGFEVVALVRSGRALSPLFESAPRGLLVVYDDGGVNRIADAMCQRAVAAVLHCAAHYVSRHQPDDVVPLVESNVLLGSRLAEAMSLAGTKTLVFLSTMWEHSGECVSDYVPANLYAATKRALQDILVYYADAVGISVAVLQMGDCYGPGDNRNKLLPALENALRSGQPIDLSPGEQNLDLLHVDDVVAGIIHAARLAASWPGGTFSRFRLTAGHTITVRGLVDALGQAMGQPVPVRWGARPYRPREVMHPGSPYPPLPGWAPQIDLNAGLLTLRASTVS